MRKVLLAVLLSTGMAFAADEPISETSMDRIATMQGMETAMSAIQKGFLYNNLEMITKGVEEFKKNSHDIQSFVIDEKVENSDFNPRRYARNEAKVITNLADEVLLNYKNGNKGEAVASYNKILNRCLVCHKIIRKW